MAAMAEALAAAADDSFGVPALDDWYDAALKQGMGFKTNEERERYIASLGDPLAHPMFATSEEDLMNSPLTEAFRQLREEDKTPLELCIMYKEEGNEWMKKADKKSWREAINIYMHSLSFVREPDVDVNVLETRTLLSQIHGNIAQANLNLKNYGSCRKAADLAIRYSKANIKAHFRKCKALASLHKYAAAAESCKEALIIAEETEQTAGLQPIQSLLESCNATLQRRRRERQDRTRAFSVQEKAWRTCWDICRSNSVILAYFNPNISLPQQLNGKAMPFYVYPTEDSDPKAGAEAEAEVAWPCVLHYPEYGQCDAIEQVKASDFLVEHLAIVFPAKEGCGEGEGEDWQPVGWDVRGDYEFDKLVVYVFVRGKVATTPGAQAPPTDTVEDVETWMQFCRDTWSLQHNTVPPSTSTDDDDAEEISPEEAEETQQRVLAECRHRFSSTVSRLNTPGRHVEVGLGCTFAQILQLPGHRLSGGLLQLFIFVKGSKAHTMFLERDEMVRIEQDLPETEPVATSLSQVKSRLTK